MRLLAVAPPRVAEHLSKSVPTVRVLRRQRHSCIDADPQHDPAILPAMLAELRGVVDGDAHGARVSRAPLRGQDFIAVRHQLSAQGFKILIEIAARLRPQRIAEVPYIFGPRTAGASKLTASVALDYVAQRNLGTVLFLPLIFIISDPGSLLVLYGAPGAPT